MLAAISIFLTPIIGVFIVKKYKKDFYIKDMIASYLLLILLCNFINIVYFKFAHDLTEGVGTKLNYDIQFFIRYTLIGMAISIVVPIIYIIINKHVQVSLVGEKNEKKKKK